MYEKTAFKKVCVQNLKRNCMGSKCMAWRWSRVKNEKYVPNMMGMSTLTHPADQVSPWKPSDSDGYCGLAGVE